MHTPECVDCNLSWNTTRETHAPFEAESTCCLFSLFFFFFLPLLYSPFYFSLLFSFSFSFLLSFLFSFSFLFCGWVDGWGRGNTGRDVLKKKKENPHESTDHYGTTKNLECSNVLYNYLCDVMCLCKIVE